MTTRDGQPRPGDGARTTRAADGDRFGWERLSAADESNFLFEHRRQVYVVGIVAVLDAAPLTDGRGEPDVAWLRGVLADRVSAVPRLNQRVHFTRPGQGRPVWVDCPADLSVHVRRGPRLDGEDDLTALGARLLGEPLARERPLWDLLVCAGPTAGEVTAVLRLHHALADGVSGVRIMGALFDAGTAVPLAAGASHPFARYPVRAPTGWELVRESWRARWFRVVDVVNHPRRLPVRWQAVAAGVRRTSTIARAGTGPTSLLGPLGVLRSVRLLAVDLGRLRDYAHANGATVNDVLLGAVASAADALLAARGEPAPAHLPVSVPVSLRGRDGPGGSPGNEVGVMRVLLPLGEPDGTARLRRIAEETRRAKQEARTAGTLELTRSRLGMRAIDVFSRYQHTIALFVTNVPGPAERMTLGGATLRHAWPLSVIAGNVRLAVAALSYAGELHVTVIADADSCPDLDIFTGALAASLSDPAG